jgi:hypothetical protein
MANLAVICESDRLHKYAGLVWLMTSSALQLLPVGQRTNRVRSQVQSVIKTQRIGISRFFGQDPKLRMIIRKVMNNPGKSARWAGGNESGSGWGSIERFSRKLPRFCRRAGHGRSTGVAATALRIGDGGHGPLMFVVTDRAGYLLRCVGLVKIMARVALQARNIHSRGALIRSKQEAAEFPRIGIGC